MMQSNNPDALPDWALIELYKYWRNIGLHLGYDVGHHEAAGFQWWLTDRQQSFHPDANESRLLAALAQETEE